MSYSGNDFMEQGAPIGDLCKAINNSFYDTYEWNRNDYGPNNQFIEETASRNEWSLDLTKVSCGYGTWGGNFPDIQNHVLYHVIQNAIEHESELQDHFPANTPSPPHEKVARNLSNAWRDEFALNDPIDGSANDRMRITEWRITMCYYAIFKATSALMHCKFGEIRAAGGSGSHASVWMKHRQEMMTPLGNQLYSYPFMYFPQATDGEHADNWFDWTVPYPIPDSQFEQEEERLQTKAENSLYRIYESLEGFTGTNNIGLNTFYDALLKLRQWANYEHGGVFARLYGDGYKQAIDETLRLMTFTGLAIAEVGIIMAIGWTRFSSLWSVFSANAGAGVEDSYAIAKQRVQVYTEAFS